MADPGSPRGNKPRPRTAQASPLDGTRLDQLRQLVSVGRIPVVVVGAGVSQGVGGPSMMDMHSHLLGLLKPKKANLRDKEPHADLTTAISLLESLTQEEPSTPRSLAVRLYKILQTSTNKTVRSTWRRFGLSLLFGMPTASRGKQEKSRTLWTLPTSNAHKWVAQLASRSHGVLILSLNFDGLTRKALEEAGQEARVLLSQAEILRFFASRTSAKRIIPVVKMRGDIFHIACENPTCPEYRKQIPIYELWRRSPPPADTKILRTAREWMNCTICKARAALQVSFPGVVEKEEDIE